MKTAQIAFQDLYDEAFTHCYGCGRNHATGHQLKSYWHADLPETIAHIRPEPHYTGGVPDHLYGGLIASLLDCHGTATAAAFKARSSGMLFDGTSTLSRCVTANLNIQFIQPVPVHVELTLKGSLICIEDRKVKVALCLAAQDKVLATAEMLAIQLK
jgi:acyl-coenzyme A thioesterase PaaI-like protein